MSDMRPVTGVAANGYSNPASPVFGRRLFLELTGTGSLVGTIHYQCNDGSFAPNAVGIDGATAKLLESVAYDGSSQNGLRIELTTDRFDQAVKAFFASVSGVVNYAFVQG